MPMKPAFDNLLKWSTVLLFLPICWVYFHPEQSRPWLFPAGPVLLFAICTLKTIYWYKNRKGRGPSGPALGEPAEK